MEKVAPIVDRTVTEIRFRVDEVQPCQTLLPTQKAKQQLEEKIESSLGAFSHDSSFEVVQTSGNHDLVNAVHLAFSDHRPLLLTPDAIWMTIAQGFAQHINNNAEKLRDRFVSHSSKKTLAVTIEKLETSDDWANAIHQWTLGIRDCVGADIYQLMLCNFSTTTPIVETASQVVMMDAFKQYFDYRLYAICGIPWIAVQGTIEDWQKIRQRIDSLATYDLDWWTKRLIPICDGFIDTVAGNPSIEFWQNICKPESAYGGDLITGWIVDLFPYIQHFVTRVPTVKNPILETPREHIKISDGILPCALPNGLSQASCILKTPQCKHNLEIVAGFIGVTQDSNTGAIGAEIGWAVREVDNFSKMLETIEQNCDRIQPSDWQNNRNISEMPKELIQIFDKLGSGTLFANTNHPWHILSSDRCQIYEIFGPNEFVTHCIALKDDRIVACGFISRSTGDFRSETYKRWSEVWIVVGKPVKVLNHWQEEQEVLLPTDTMVIAKGLPQFLQRVIEAEGRYYFDDPSFVPDDSFLDLIPQ